MKKILVTTDLSTNSTAGLRFAIQLATQAKLQLIFLYVNKIMKYTFVPDHEHKMLLEKERDDLRKELETLVHSVYRSMQITPEHYKCVLFYDFGVVNSIMEYAESNHCSYICISTQGAGNATKFLGTTTSTLISESKVPVLCIPKGYQARPVSRLLYFSDLVNHNQELKLVIDFARSVNAEVQMLHFLSPGSQSPVEHDLERALKKFRYNVVTHIERRNAGTLLEEIDEAVVKFDPCLLIMFTSQDRPFLDLLFLPSQSERYSFRTRVPLLVFSKQS